MAGPWPLRYSEQFCLTVSLDKSPEEVMAIYGADPGQARLLPMADAPYVPPPDTTLHVGHVGEWTFGIDFDEHIGSTKQVMRDLSEQGESMILFRTAKALTVFHYAVNGRIAEWFEPGYPPSSRGVSPHQFSQRVHELTSVGIHPVSACLQVIARRTGRELTTEDAHGPLHTVVIEKPDRAALEHPEPLLLFPVHLRKNSRPLGRRLHTGRRSAEDA
ncbi:DUF6461 domain-containing protein [Streptomyces californicus]|uniref:DUF6461 domain-containing protein n=1 Tax=Streptomyces californicus TaxID=67351 RepID=UPI0036FB7722